LELGQGGTAVVYLAVAQGPAGFNKLLVLKAPKRALADDPEYRSLFLDEARLSARLNHPNIVQVNEVVEQDGVPIIVMEYLEGQPLVNLRTKAGASFPQVMHLRILSEALSGLRYSHELKGYDGTPLNLVHRDMTPHNVFVTYEGQVKILDFGIAKLSTKGGAETETGVIKGKLRYMPPEQISGERVDCRTDVFAVGVMLWEAAAGKKMWSDFTEATIMTRVLRGEIPSPREENPEVSVELDRIVMKALAPDPDERYATANALQADIDAYLQSVTTPSTLREVGQFVSQLFAESRQRTHAIIEQHLNELNLHKDQLDGTGPIAFPPDGPLPLRLAAITGNTPAKEFGTLTRVKPWHSRGITIAIAALVASAAAVVFWVSRGPTGPAAATAPSIAAPPTPQPEAKPPAAETRNVSLQVSAIPKDAIIYLDDARLSGNPASLTVPADARQHHLRAEAVGHEPTSTVRIFDKDTEVILTLKKLEPSRPSTYSKKRPSTPTAPAKSNCNPPYVFDENGFKTFKPECL
jgi:eukaryotic-like serine/threonine-protein kinase